MQATLKDLLKEYWLRERNSGSIYWTTKDGRNIPIKDMDNTHLLNTIKMLVKQEERMEHLGDMSPIDYWD